MAISIYEAAATKTTTGSAQFIVTVVPAALSATAGMPEVREIGIFNVSGAASEVGIGLAWHVRDDAGRRGHGAELGGRVRGLDHVHDVRDAADHADGVHPEG